MVGHRGRGSFGGVSTGYLPRLRCIASCGRKSLAAPARMYGRGGPPVGAAAFDPICGVRAPFARGDDVHAVHAASDGAAAGPRSGAGRPPVGRAIR